MSNPLYTEEFKIEALKQVPWPRASKAPAYLIMATVGLPDRTPFQFGLADLFSAAFCGLR